MVGRECYVGSHDLLELLKEPNARMRVGKPAAALSWAQASREPPNPDGTFTATFIMRN